MKDRALRWEGCTNARDLGGLRTGDGHVTRWGALVRSDTPTRLSTAGWAALYTYGIRTIVTLGTHGMVEVELEFTPPYPDVTRVEVAIEDITDVEFEQQWAASGLWCTPLYFQDALRRWPERHAAAISAIARAQPGGVLFHSIRGHDRTGIVALLLLALAGVTLEEIVADHEQSPDPYRDKILARERSSVREAIRGALAGLDLDSYLVTGGASPGDLAAVRQRLP